MDKKWLKPLRYGIIIGTILGLVSGYRETLAPRLFDYHFYNLAFHSIARDLNTNLVLILAVSYALALLGNLAIP